MKKITAKVVSVYLGAEGELGNDPVTSLEAELDGFIGDRHKSISRSCWAGDKQREGSIRRNERHWCAVSVEELAEIAQILDLSEPLTAATLGPNILIEGVPKLSQLPKGTTLTFPSGAELIVEEYNPPCMGMSENIASLHSTNSGKPLRDTSFSKAAQYLRGVVGVIEVAGTINAGDTVTVKPYELPRWMANGSDSQ